MNSIPISGEESRVNIEDDLRRHFELTLGKDRPGESHHYLYRALALTLRDRMVEDWRRTRDNYRDERPRRRDDDELARTRAPG